MQIHTLEKWQHKHHFHLNNPENEKRTLQVVLLTLVMMVIEIGAGMAFGSMALQADGWHMGTHAAALGITLLAYYYSRKYANDPRYTFGTGKMGVLGGFTSAIVLLIVALLMAFESLVRLFNPETIQFTEAMVVAGIGLTVNLVSALLLQGGHAHDHEHHEHDHTHEDHNIKAAYFHVLADALTSVLAIIALFAGKALGWVWMDAVMGIVGAVVIIRWSRGLLTDTGSILLDQRADKSLIEEVRSAVEADADNQIADMHIWRINSNQYAAEISLVTHQPQPVEHYKNLLAALDEVIHVNVEVNVCNCRQAPVQAVEQE